MLSDNNNIKTLSLHDIVEGCATNSEGFRLFNVLDVEIAAGRKVKLSFENSHPMSSSFLNSSIGNLIEKYGIDMIKENLIFINILPSRALAIKDYITSLTSQHSL